MYQLALNATSRNWALVEDILDSYNVVSVSQTGGDGEIFADPVDSADGEWSKFLVTAIFENPSDANGAAKDLSKSLNLPFLPIEFLEPRDWCQVYKC